MHIKMKPTTSCAVAASHGATICEAYKKNSPSNPNDLAGIVLYWI